MNFGVRPGFRYTFWYLGAGWCWISQLTSLALSFFIWKMALIIHGFYWWSLCAGIVLLYTVNLYNNLKWDVHICDPYFIGEIIEVARLGALKSLIRIIHVICRISCYIAESPEMVACVFLLTLVSSTSSFSFRSTLKVNEEEKHVFKDLKHGIGIDV